MTFKIIASQFYDRSGLRSETESDIFYKGYSKLTSYTFYQKVLSISMTFKNLLADQQYLYQVLENAIPCSITC